MAARPHGSRNIGPAAHQLDRCVVEQQPAPQLPHEGVRLVVVPAVGDQAPAWADEPSLSIWTCTSFECSDLRTSVQPEDVSTA